MTVMSDTDQAHLPKAYPPDADLSYSRRVLVAVGLTIASVLAIVIIWRALNVLLLIFTGVLFGIFLHFFKCRIVSGSRLGPKSALVVVLFFIFSVFILFFTLFVPVFKEQSITLIQEIPKFISELEGFFLRFHWGQDMVGEPGRLESFFSDFNSDKAIATFTNLVSIFSTTFGAFAGLLFILVIGIYIGAELDVYFNGIIRLMPLGRRARGGEILHHMGDILRWWLFGQSLAMLFLGILVFAGLWFIGVPYAATLALFTALMTFIPNLGPIIAYVPTAMVTLTKSPALLLYVTVFYIVIQTIEGNFITPMVHRKAIVVPPALILSAQVVLFQLIGFLGVILAMPLVACAMVLVQMIYIEDILGDVSRKNQQDRPVKAANEKKSCECGCPLPASGPLKEISREKVAQAFETKTCKGEN